MMSALRFICIMGLLNAVPLPTQAAAEEPASQIGSEELDATMVEVSAKFIYEVPANKNSEATAILAADPIVELDNKQVVSLLGKEPDIEARIDKISDGYVAHAKHRAAAAANPKLSKYSTEFLSDSKVNFRYAEYYQRLKKRTRPFLLIGLASGQYNAKFYGIWRGNTLKVINSYLGYPSTDNPFPVPVIVYLRDKPENIEATTRAVK